MHETGRKGDIGVAMATADLLSKGLQVLMPVASTSPYDLVATDDRNFWRVQVKYVNIRAGVLKMQARRTVISNGRITTRPFNGEIDVICIYSPHHRQCFYFRADEGLSAVSVRDEYPSNGIKKGIRLTSNFLTFPPS